MLNLPHVANASACCCFNDVMDLQKPKASCCRHEEDCVVPTDILGYACGFSCCPYSKYNAKSSANRGAVARVESGEHTGEDGVDTAIGNFKYIAKARPLLSFMENVEEFDDDGLAGNDDDAEVLKSILGNMGALRTMFEDDGFAFAALLVNALDYGLPQARKRVYLVAVPLDHELLQVVPTAGFTTELEAMMKSLILSMRPLGLFLLPDDDPCLQRELERLQHAKAQAKDKLEKDTKWQVLKSTDATGIGGTWVETVPGGSSN